MLMKNSNDTIGNRTRDLSDCSAVPQPTAPHHATTAVLLQIVARVRTTSTAISKFGHTTFLGALLFLFMCFEFKKKDYIKIISSDHSTFTNQHGIPEDLYLHLHRCEIIRTILSLFIFFLTRNAGKVLTPIFLLLSAADCQHVSEVCSYKHGNKHLRSMPGEGFSDRVTVCQKGFSSMELRHCLYCFSFV
jgi:hypothetical protein